MRVLLAQVDEALGRLCEAHRDQHPFEHEVRTALEEVAVLDRSGLALVGVQDRVARRRLARYGLPLQRGWEARAAVADQPGGLQLLEDGIVRPVGAQRLEAAAPLVVGECRVLRGEPGGSAVARAVGDRLRRPAADGVLERGAVQLRQDRVAARADGSEVAVPEARHLDDRQRLRGELLSLRQQLARAEAVADGTRADAQRLERHAQERVEGGDLVHLAATDVHVVGERIGELGRDRPDLTPDASQVVEQASPLLRELSEQGRKAQDVDSAILSRHLFQVHGRLERQV